MATKQKRNGGTPSNHAAQQGARAAQSTARGSGHPRPHAPGQVVLVLQGGGALGAYHVGVYEALHEAGIEPAWVIGTSIGAINAALIAGNPLATRLQRLHEFWTRVEHGADDDWMRAFTGIANVSTNLCTITRGVPGFFVPNPSAWWSSHLPLGVERAAYYSTAPLRDTLAELVELDRSSANHTRLTVGAVNVRNGEMRYFDSRDHPITLDHILASGALPPAFPAVRIDGDPYWDGGIYSNTPVEAVLDDHPRRDSLIFTVNVWNPEGTEPSSVWEVMGRAKDIQYASRAKSHIARQKQIHHLRHVIRELALRMPERERATSDVRELAAWGCGTTMHVVRLNAPNLDGEDHTKDIDFSPQGILARRRAGYADTRRMIERSPWEAPVHPADGVVIHEPLDATVPLASGVDGFAERTR
jgi:NTE family protein